MKNNMWTLTKILWKTGGNLDLKGRKIGKKYAKQWIWVFLALCFAPLVGTIITAVSGLYTILTPLGQEGLILIGGITLSAFMIFFFGLFYIMNIFYFANDVEYLLPLPLKPSEIMGAKFIVTVFYEYLTQSILLVPILIVFGIRARMGFLYYLYGGIIFVLLPIVPLAVASILMMVIMRYANLSKHKDAVRIVGGIFGILIAVSVNLFTQRFFGPNYDPMQMQDMLQQGNNSLVEVTTTMFPTSRWASLGLVHSGAWTGAANILLFCLASLVTMLILFALGERYYLKGVVGSAQSADKKKTLSSEKLQVYTRESSPLKAYIVKEIRLLFRNPTYFLNCILMNFLWPIFIMIPLVTGGSEIAGFREILGAEEAAPYILAVGFVALLFVGGANGVTSTAISREGENMFFNRYIPLHYREQLTAKVLSGILIGCIGMGTMLIAAGILFRIGLGLLLLLILTGTIGITFISLTGILIDLWNPKLQWENEQQAVKQNWNLLLNLLLAVVAGGLTMVGVFALKPGIWGVMLMILLVFGVLDVILYHIVSGAGVKRMSQLE